MDILEQYIMRYRENIPNKEVRDLFSVFYETRDEKIRENLIYRYMSMAKRIILSIGITSIEEEDLEQMAYEYLIQCLDKYNPNLKTDFNGYLYRYIYNKCLKYIRYSEKGNISLTDLDVFSNECLEEKIINQIEKNELLEYIYLFLEKSSAKKRVEVFKMYYGLDSESMKTFEIVRSNGITKQAVNNYINRMIIELYISFLEEYCYYPSTKIEKYLTQIRYFYYTISKEKRDYLDSINLNELDYITFYRDFNELSDSHEILTKKLK